LNPYETKALCIPALTALVASVKAAFVGFDGERIPEDIALPASGLYGLGIGLADL
jgi:hypothetical protein